MLQLLLHHYFHSDSWSFNSNMVLFNNCKMYVSLIFFFCKCATPTLLTKHEQRENSVVWDNQCEESEQRFWILIYPCMRSGDVPVAF